MGCVAKDFEPIAKALLKNCKKRTLPVIGRPVYVGRDVQIVASCYGGSMVMDAFKPDKSTKKITEPLLADTKQIIFVGSMGALAKKRTQDSLIPDIEFKKLFLPTKVFPFYANFFFGSEIQQNKASLNLTDGCIEPDQELSLRIEKYLQKHGLAYSKFSHGTSMAVWGPYVDHATYTYDLSDDLVGSLDLELYFGLKICKDNNIKAAALMYCIDLPKLKISDIPQEEFEKTEKEMDFLLNKVAFDVLTKK
jgi:hypothetical protein